MNKKDLIKAVAARTGMKQKDAMFVIEYLLTDIKFRLIKRFTVNIRGFGRFQARTDPEKIFTPSRALVKKINE
jgi:nucleoid DNA-binding protein